MRRFDLILAAALLAAPMAQAGGLMGWSDATLGISAQVPQGWVQDALPGGGVLFTQPGLDPHKAAHVAFRAHPAASAALGPLHDQTLRAHLLNGDKVLRDTVDAGGFDLRAQEPETGTIDWQITRQLECADGPRLTTLEIRFGKDQATAMEALLAPIPETLACNGS